MNHSPFWPLVWKEYRAGRAFWLSMAAMGLLLQAGVWWLARPSHDRDAWLYQIALMISAGFAVGIGGTLFAAENEEQTIALLRRLPVRPQALGAAKLLAAAAGLGALLVMLWLAARGLTGGGMLVPREVATLWTTWGLACVEGLAWGILGSLLIPRPLWATLTAALAIVFVNAGLGWPDHLPSSMMEYGRSTLFRTVLLVVVVTADVMLLPGWLLGRDVARRQRRVRAQTSLWRRTVRHLAWQTIREGKASFLVLAGVVLLVLATNFPTYVRTGNVVNIAVILVMLAAANGALVFRADQSHGPRFLAERGTSPRAIWFTRHLVWGIWLWFLLAMIILLSGLGTADRLLDLVDDERPLEWFHMEPLVNFWLPCSVLLLSAYSAGQLASFFLRRTLLSITFGILAGGLVLAWFVLTQWISAPYWWSVLPLPIGFLLATYLRMPRWLVERGGWRGWLVPLLAAAAPLGALSIAVPAFRVLQIPAVASALDPVLPAPESSPAALAEAQKTLDLYMRAFERWRTDRPAAQGNAQAGDAASQGDNVAAWAKPALDLAMEASRREQSLLVLPVETRFSACWPIMTAQLTELARAKQLAGDFDAALDAWLAALRADMQYHQCNPENTSVRRQEILEGLQIWGAGTGQSAERIRGAIDRLTAWHATWPGPADLLLPFYQEDQLVIDDLPAADRFGLMQGNRQGSYAASIDRDLGGRWLFGTTTSEQQWLSSRLSWERQRARRLLDWQAYFQLAVAEETAKDFAHDRPTGLEWSPGFDNRRGLLVNSQSGITQSWKSWEQRAGWWLLSTPLLEGSLLVSESLAWLMLCDETDYRATLISLALEAWRAEHGALPSELDELVGHGLEKVPLDPLKAQPFVYGLGLYQPDDHDASAGPAEPPSAEAPAGDQPIEPDVWARFGRRFLHSALNPDGAGRGGVVFGSAGLRDLSQRQGTLYFIPDVWEPKP